MLRPPHVHALSATQLISRLATTMADVLEGTARRGDRCSLVLAGGTTPRLLYKALVDRARARDVWNRVHVFWGDERYVPHDDPRSNYRMARETLLDHVAIPAANIHPMPTHFADPDDAARDYEETLRGHFGGAPRFDLALLGMGADGHTASLFPGSPALAERTRWVVPVTANADPPTRLTLTLPALNAAKQIHFLVTGAEKAAALEHVLSGSADPQEYPAAAVQPVDGEVTWWIEG